MLLTPFRKRLILKSGIAGVIIVILWVAIILFSSHLDKQVQAINDTKVQIALRDRTVAQLAGSNNDLKRAEPLLSRMQTIIPQADQLLVFRKEVIGYGKQFGANVAFDLGASVPATATDPGTNAFTLSIAGRYEDIESVLRLLEAHPYFIRFQDMTLNYREEKSQYSLITSGVIYIK